MYDARNLRRFVMSHKRRAVGSTITTTSSTGPEENKHATTSITDNNDNDNDNNQCDTLFHFYLPRFAVSTSLILLLVASLTVVVNLHQESQYMMMKMTNSATLPPQPPPPPRQQQQPLIATSKQEGGKSSSVSSVSLYLEEQGQQSLCASSEPDASIVVEELDPPIPTKHNWTDYLEGPALDPRIMEEAVVNGGGGGDGGGLGRIAACKFHQDNHSAHFPHALQQVYRCISWWQYHREQEQEKQQQQQRNNASTNATITTTTTTTELFLIWPKSAPRTTPFLAGLLQALRKIWKLRIVPLRGHIPIVRAKVQYGYLLPLSSQREQQHQQQQQLTSLGYQTRQVSDLQNLRNDLVQEFYPHRLRYEQQRRATFSSLSSTSLSLSDGQEQQQQQQDASSYIPKITIVNRHVDSGRSILNAQELYQALQEQFGQQQGQQSSSSSSSSQAIIQLVPHLDRWTFPQQFQLMSHTDILISPHGAQLSSLFLLPPCSSILELFGRGYSCPEFYGSLAAASGHVYAHIYTPGSSGGGGGGGGGSGRAAGGGDGTAAATTTTGTTMSNHNQTNTTLSTASMGLAFWMKDLESRNVARLFPMCAPIPTIVQYIQKELVDWKKRMQNPLQYCS